MARSGLFCNQYAFQKQVLKEYAATNIQHTHSGFLHFHS